jgi:hypothetical protein
MALRETIMNYGRSAAERDRLGGRDKCRRGARRAAHRRARPTGGETDEHRLSLPCAKQEGKTQKECFSSNDRSGPC